MKNTLLIVMALIILLTLASCVYSPNAEVSLSPSPEPELSPTDEPTDYSTPQAHYEASIYKTKEDFYNAIIEIKSVSDGKGGSSSADGTMSLTERGTATHNKVEEIAWYFDFTNLVDEVVLGDIIVKPEYIKLYYNDKNGKGGSGIYSLLLLCDRRSNPIENLEELYLARDRTVNTIDIMINGNVGTKNEGSYFNGYRVNSYYWVEDGYAMELRIPAWLLDLYPEETFFDIQVVNVPTTRAGDIE